MAKKKKTNKADLIKEMAELTPFAGSDKEHKYLAAVEVTGSMRGVRPRSWTWQNLPYELR